MKVIAPGRPQKGWATEERCTGNGNGNGGCGALLLVEEGDLFGTSRCLMGKEMEYYTTFACCQCGVYTDLKDALVPRRVAEAARKRKPYYREGQPNGG